MLSDELKKLIEKQYDKVDKANSDIVDIWIDHILFTFSWWISLFLLVVPWILWLKYRKKKSTTRLLTAGIWVAFIATWLNYIGVTLGLWRYNVKLIPVIPDFLPWDFSLLPVTVMLFIQYKPKTKPFIKAILFASLVSFIGEPLFKWLDFFEYPGWHFLASFPFYIGIYLVANSLAMSENFDSLHN